jgi:hypothetical protein
MALHSLAIELGMTVGKLMDELTVQEFADWIQYYKQRDEEPEPPELTPEAMMGLFNG